VSRGRKERHACSVIRTRQHREMESSCASAAPAREPENIEAAGKARERETNTSDQLTAPEARKGRETSAPCPREMAMSMGAWETNMPVRETAGVRRDGEPLTSGVQERRQKEAAANRHQAAAGEQPPPSVGEEARFVPLSATDPKCELRDMVSADRQQLTAARVDQAETSHSDPRLNDDPEAKLRLEARCKMARWSKTGTDYLSPLAVRRIIPVASKDIMGPLTAVCRLDREVHELSVTHPGGGPIEQMESVMQMYEDAPRTIQVAREGVEGSPNIDVEEHSCSMMNAMADQQARLAAIREQRASIAAQPQALWLSTADAETSTPEETGLVPGEADLVPAEADLVPAEADQGSAEEQLVPAEADLVPAETPLVPARARPTDTARERTPSAVTEDPGPVLPSKWETGATAVCAGAMRPVESVEALTSPRSRAGTPAATGEEPREPKGAAPSPPRKRCNVAGQGGWKDQLTCRGPGLKFKEFRELPPAARLNLVREHGLCRLCLSCCDPEGKRMQKRCWWKNRILNELCQEQHKCRQTHHRLLHVDAEGERSLQMARPAKPASCLTD
jgi:hypothetical protein